MQAAFLVLLAATAFFGVRTAAGAVQPEVNGATLATFLRVSEDTSYFERSAFEKNLAQELQARPDLAAAAKALAAKYNLDPALMGRFAKLWIQFVLLRENAWPPQEAGSYVERERIKASNSAEMRKAFIQLARDARHASLIVEHAATAMTNWSFGDGCPAGEFAEVVDGTKDLRATAWAAATHSGGCERWRLEALALFPDDTAMMWGALDSSYARVDQRLALLRMIENSQAVRGLAQGDATAFRTALARKTIGFLWDAGLVEDGLTYFESLPERVRKNLVEERQPSARFSLGDLPVVLKTDEWLKPDRTVSANDFRVDLAVALYIVGRNADAKKLYHAFPHPEMARKGQVCALSEDSKIGACEHAYEDTALTMLAIELALVRPGDDPYDLVEMQFGNHHSSRLASSGLWFRLYRKRLNEPVYAASRAELAEIWNPNPDDYRNSGIADELDKAMSEPTRVLAHGFKKSIQAKRVEMGLPPDFPRHDRARAERTSAIGPSAYRFAERKLKGRCVPPASKQPELAPLPEGFGLVRAERNGDIAFAISLSQNLDPVGEVSGGGYWVHLSGDGGKTWDKTLYTGLAQFFPYAVAPSSCRKMWAGDRLEVEVEIAELDRASITYPPIGLRTTRRAGGLYLDIPLAALEADADRDLITDIEEEHLLLNPNKSDSDGDGMRDGVDPLPNIVNGKSKRDTDRAMALALGEIFGGSFGAIIEGIDTDDQPLEERLAQPRRRDLASAHRPIFIEGDARDYAGVRPPAMMLVYSEKQIGELETMTPIFHAVKLWPLVMNRERSRGFLKWSARWVGGTLRVTREGTGWKVERISDWIT